jgi:outer membrane translocation and assembly module TamA
MEILKSNLEQQKRESSFRAEQQTEQFKSYLARLMDGGERELTAFKTILHESQKVRDTVRQVLRCSDDKTLKTCIDKLEKSRFGILDTFAEQQTAFSEKADRELAHNLKTLCDRVAGDVLTHARIAHKGRAAIPPELNEQIDNLGVLHGAFSELACNATERFLTSLKPTRK